MRITGDLALGPDCTAVEWLISILKSISASVAADLNGASVGSLLITEGAVDGLRFPEVPGADAGSLSISFGGSDINFTGGDLPGGTGTVSVIRITARVDGVSRDRTIEFPEPVSLDAMLGETARNPETSKRIEDNPGFATLVLPTTSFLAETGTEAADLIKGFETDDFLNGGQGDDIIFGRGGNDRIDGGPGDDVLDGGPGQDVLSGGDGLDQFSGTMDGLFGDTISDLTTDDSIFVTDLNRTGAFVETVDRDLQTILRLWASPEGPSSELTLEGDFVDRIFELESFEGGTRVFLDVPGRTLNGTDGPDLLEGDRGDDILNGGPGNDTLCGFDGDDRLLGEAGNDLLEGGDGTDTLNGGDGDDLIRGGATDADRRDVVYAGAGNDSVDGGHGNDLIFGQGGNDTLAGGFGADELQGQDGDDVITGSAFGDIVFGNAGNDFVNGGFGHDLINGGTGADKFFHTGGTREQMEGHGSDWVQDYSSAEGDVLVFGGSGNAGQFQVNTTHTANKETGERAGDDDVEEAFVIYKPTGQILWALVDGGGEASINLQIGAEVFDLLG